MVSPIRTNKKKSSFLFVMCLMDLIRKVAKSGGSQAHIRNILIRYRWLMRRKIRNLALFHIQISLENFWASNTLIPLKAIINGHFSTETGKFEIFTILCLLILTPSLVAIIENSRLHELTLFYNVSRSSLGLKSILKMPTCINKCQLTTYINERLH